MRIFLIACLLLVPMLAQASTNTYIGKMDIAPSFADQRDLQLFQQVFTGVRLVNRSVIGMGLMCVDRRGREHGFFVLEDAFKARIVGGWQLVDVISIFCDAKGKLHHAPVWSIK